MTQKKLVVQSKNIQAYFDYYDLNFPCKKHYFGKFKSQGYILTGHIFIPDNSKGFVIILHGYLDHSATMKNLIRFFIRYKYAVGIYDMPGHGFSSGEKAAIDNFHVYSAILKDFHLLCKKYFSGSFHLAGHSTGCSAAIDYILYIKKTNFDKIILIAPLVRSTFWYFSKVAAFMLSPFSNKIPRRFIMKNSSDKNFLEFTKNDPLQYRYLSLRWLNALHIWNNELKNLDLSNQRIYIIQGSKDKTVNWKYNLNFINKKFPNSQNIIIMGGKHHLVNETIKIKKQVFNLILDVLNN